MSVKGEITIVQVFEKSQLVRDTRSLGTVHATRPGTANRICQPALFPLFRVSNRRAWNFTGSLAREAALQEVYAFFRLNKSRAPFPSDDFRDVRAETYERVVQQVVTDRRLLSKLTTFASHRVIIELIVSDSVQSRKFSFCS